jgi:protocatechuate 3,4-dioxygenase beta subunit
VPRTPPATAGPFYPTARPADQDWDLTRLKGSRGAARGQAINVMGRVVDREGRPLAGARVDLWQANAAGRYDHPRDGSDAPLDTNFQGSAVLVADAEGRFRVRTIKPGGYGDSFGRRTPHIHLTVTGARERLTTQMYFPGEPGNATDVLLRNANPREAVIARAIARLEADPDALAFGWQVVL